MNTGLRVAMLIQGYHPRIGGAERQLMALLPYLREQDVETLVLTRRYAGLAAKEVIDGTPVQRLPAPGPKAAAALAYSLAALPALARFRPQVVHAHNVSSDTLPKKMTCSFIPSSAASAGTSA